MSMHRGDGPELIPSYELQNYKDRELVAYIRDTIIRLESLADRLEGYIKEEPNDDN